MLTNELLEFISAQHDAGTSLSEIEQMLIGEGGWESGDVDEAFRSLGFVREEVPSTVPPSPAAPLPETEAAPVLVDQPLSTTPEVEFIPPVDPVMQAPVREPLSPPPVMTVEQAVVQEAPLSDEGSAPTEGGGHEDFLGLFSDAHLGEGNEREPEAPNEAPPASVEELPPPPVAPLPAEHPETLQTASEWSLNYMLAKAAAGKPLSIPKEELPVDFSPPSDLAAGIVSETTPETLPPPPPEVKEVPPFSSPGLSPEQRIVAEERTAPVDKFDPDAWKEKDVKATSTAELWLARGGKPTPAMVPVSPPSTFEAAPPSPLSSGDEKVAPGPSNSRSLLRVLLMAMTVVVLLGLSAAGAYYYFSSRGPKAVDVLNQSVTSILGASGVSYAGEIHADLNFSGTGASPSDAGRVRFALGSQGQLAESTRGFGDGSHRFHLAGELHSGAQEWQTDLEGEVRVIDHALYFHAITIPKSDQIDPDLLRTYWIKLNLAEIAQELGIGGGKNGEPYGDFGASDLQSTFATVFLRQMPLRIAKEIGKENLDGVDVYHYALAIDPVAGQEFMRTFYKTITGKDLNMTEDEKVRLGDALHKISGEVWIGTLDGLPKKVTLTGDLDDELLGVRVKGTLGLSLAPKILPAPATVDMPTPVLSLEELRVRMDEYKQTQSLRAEDEGSVEGVVTITEALDAYKTKFGRYPDQLTQLFEQGLMSTTTLSRELAQYTYYAYATNATFDRAHRCSPKAKTCPLYHLGVNLHDITNPALSSDADRTGDISGDDALGCGREKGLACYDVVPALSPAPVPQGKTLNLTPPAKSP